MGEFREKYLEFLNKFGWIFIVCAVVVVVMGAIFIIVGIRRAKAMRELNKSRKMSEDLRGTYYSSKKGFLAILNREKERVARVLEVKSRPANPNSATKKNIERLQKEKQKAKTQEEIEYYDVLIQKELNGQKMAYETNAESNAKIQQEYDEYVNIITMAENGYLGIDGLLYKIEEVGSSISYSFLFQSVIPAYESGCDVSVDKMTIELLSNGKTTTFNVSKKGDYYKSEGKISGPIGINDVFLFIRRYCSYVGNGYGVNGVALGEKVTFTDEIRYGVTRFTDDMTKYHLREINKTEGSRRPKGMRYKYGKYE